MTIEKNITYITEKTYITLTNEEKIQILMHMKNRAILRYVLAGYMSNIPFENFSKSKNKLLQLGDKYFKVFPKESLIKEE